MKVYIVQLLGTGDDEDAWENMVNCAFYKKEDAEAWIEKFNAEQKADAEEADDEYYEIESRIEEFEVV